MDVSGEFLRPEFAFEREFGQFRNWWARDKRIVGNAFSLLIYLVSHDRNFRVTQKRAQGELGLGRDAFLVARRKLEQAGFLTVTEHRYAAGAVDENGRPIGGHRQVIFTLQDPEQPQNQADRHGENPNAENPLRASRPSKCDVQSVNLDSSDSPSPHGAEESMASAGNPTQAFPSLKEDQPQEDQQSSSSRDAGRFAAASCQCASDEEDGLDGYVEGTATLFRELHHRLDLRRLLEKLGTDRRLNICAIDLERAAAEVIGRSARPVGDPVAYLATAISREPGRWAKVQQAEEAVVSATPSAKRPPTIAECDAAGHRWIGSWNECCAICGAERDGWRDQRDLEGGVRSARESAFK